MRSVFVDLQFTRHGVPQITQITCNTAALGKQKFGRILCHITLLKALFFYPNVETF
jgi:hypothetical protein